MKPFSYYSKPQISYPLKINYITFYVYDKGECIYEKSNSTTESITKSQLSRKYPNAVIQEVFDEDTYKARCKEYDAENTRLYQEFQNDLFEEYGVSDNPKKFKCFELAWEYGRFSGYEGVYNHFGDLVELILD